MYCLNEFSSKLTTTELAKIHSKLNITLKEHQNTIIKSMIQLEDTNKINLILESKITKQDILVKEDLYIPTYDLYYRRPYLNINDFKFEEFEIETNYGILADKVGAGKTYEMLGLIAHKLVPNNFSKIISTSYYSMIKHIDKSNYINTNLIILPHSLTNQWKDVLELTNFKYLVINKKLNIINLDTIANKNEEADKKMKYVEDYEIILISATMLDEFYTKFFKIKWARIIIDEIISIKLPVYMELKFNFIWYITATPSGIKMIKRTYIREMVSGIQRSIFNRMIIKNTDEYVSKSMLLPPLKQFNINCSTPTSLRLIRDFVPHDVMSMLNAGNIKDAILKLNCNIDTDDNIIKVITNKLNKDIHNASAELNYMSNIIPTDNKVHEESIKKIKSKIEGYKTRLESIKEKLKDVDKEECPICLSDINMPAIIPCCNNVFCFSCLANVRGKCPMCRSLFLMQNLNIINNNIVPIVKKELLPKNENLVNIIKNKPNGKFLVFSSYDITNENIARLFDKEKITYSKICGNSGVINKTIERFKNGETSVLLLNAQHFGSGLNLQMATDIIIYHEMELDLETQVIGRAQRLGRENSLNVYYLLHDHEKSNCKNPSLDLDLLNIDDDAVSITNSRSVPIGQSDDENIVL